MSPNSAGMDPVSWLLRRRSCETRPLMTVTPYHSDKGLSLNQLVLLVQLGPSVAL